MQRRLLTASGVQQSAGATDRCYSWLPRYACRYHPARSPQSVNLAAVPHEGTALHDLSYQYIVLHQPQASHKLQPVKKRYFDQCIALLVVDLYSAANTHE